MKKFAMIRAALTWLGFVQPTSNHDQGHHGGHAHGGGHGHGHTYGVVDPTIATTVRGIWAIKWSFVILAITALLQLAVVLVSGSVALLADTIHNVGDAATAVPLWIAFLLARRKSSLRFTYGLGRAEDLAGVVVVLIILFSAIVAGYEAIDRLIHQQPITYLGWVALAGITGFIGNEAVAVFRIRVGRQINSAALIADGYHARTDGLTSLAVVFGAIGVWFGFPLTDPIIGLLITLAIFGIVWQSGKAVFTRMLDGVEPEITADIRHAAEHMPGIRRVLDVRARWLGHRLNAELDIALDPATTLVAADTVVNEFEQELFQHMPALAAARIRVRPFVSSVVTNDTTVGGEANIDVHANASESVEVKGALADGVVAIVGTPSGERLSFTASRALEGLQATVEIQRDRGRVEKLELLSTSANSFRFESATAPAEPHEFDAKLVLAASGQTEVLAFRMVEPHGHRAAHSAAHGHPR